MKRMVVVLNPGHTPETKGKRSPDGSLKEYQWAREVANIANGILSENGIANIIAKADKESDSLTIPVKMANQLCTQCGVSNVLFISIHCNAQSSDGKWHDGNGWEIYTSRGTTKSDILATCMFNAAKEIFKGHKMRSDFTDGDADKESDFYVLKHTLCPAVLIENFFLDNRDDCEYLKTTECKENAARVILEGVKEYLKRNK